MLSMTVISPVDTYCMHKSAIMDLMVVSLSLAYYPVLFFLDLL